jgi:hypothetical protein
MAKPKFYTRTSLLKLAGLHHSAGRYTGRKALAALERILMVVPRERYEHDLFFSAGKDEDGCPVAVKVQEALSTGCNTQACAAGFGAVAFQGGHCAGLAPPAWTGWGNFSPASLAVFYGITSEEAEEIFFYTERDEDTASGDYKKRTPKQTAAIIRRVLKRYAKKEKARG